MGLAAASVVSGSRVWETTASELALDEPWFRVRRDTVRLPNGEVVEYYASVRQEIALVCPVTPAREVVLMRQWKQGIGAVTLELPGGVCEPGEEPRAAARELLEETGYACASCQLLGIFELDPAKDSHRVHVFLGLDAERVAEPRADPQEEIELELRPLDGLRAAVASGELTSLGTVAGIYRALEELI